MPSGCRAGAVLAAAGEESAALQRALLDEQGRLQPGLQVAVNGELIALHEVPGRTLADGARVMVLPMVGGGSQETAGFGRGILTRIMCSALYLFKGSATNKW